MIVACPGCGRRYEAERFRHGRTIHCTCGSRVGLRDRVGPPPAGARPRLFADAMLGRLARWLRTLGLDTAYDDAIADEELVRRALEEGRWILTRDRKLLEEWRIDGALLVRSEKPLDQLAEVAEAFELGVPDRLFTRCRVCNGVPAPVTRTEVADRVPAGVLERAPRFTRCPDCGRIYWEGSHTARMRAVLARALEGA